MPHRAASAGKDGGSFSPVKVPPADLSPNSASIIQSYLKPRSIRASFMDSYGAENTIHKQLHTIHAANKKGFQRATHMRMGTEIPRQQLFRREGNSAV